MVVFTVSRVLDIIGTLPDGAAVRLRSMVDGLVGSAALRVTKKRQHMMSRGKKEHDLFHAPKVSAMFELLHPPLMKMISF